MAQSVPNQAHINGSIGTESRDAPNGTGNNGSDVVVIDATNFGVFHDQIQGEVAKLEEGCDRVNNAVEMLSKTFAKYGKIVNTVGQRWGKDQALEDEIRDLQAANKELIKQNSRDRDDHEKELSEVEQKHKEKLSSLQKQAEAGKKEKKKCEELRKSLQDEHDKAQQKLDRDFEKKIAKLESDNSEKIAKLEAQNLQLKIEKAQLEQDLATRTAQRDRERDAHKIVQAEARAEFQALEKELTGIKASYRLESLTLEFYEGRYQVVLDQVSNLATTYFTSLPETAIEDPVQTSSKLSWNAPNFTGVPIGNSECARILRLANVQHIIFNALNASVWQPFFSRYMSKERRNSSILVDIYTGLEASGKDIQQNWKISTLKILSQLDEKVDATHVPDGLIDPGMMTALKVLLDGKHVKQFLADLDKVFVAAIDVGLLAERDESPIYIDTNPSMNDPFGWKEFLSEDYHILGDNSPSSPTSPTTGETLKPLLVSPKIYRLKKTASTVASPTATPSSHTTANGDEIEIVRPGYALFLDTGIIQQGLLEWQRIKGAGREAATRPNTSGRRSSSAITSSGLGIFSPPRSPLEASRNWPGAGKLEYS